MAWTAEVDARNNTENSSKIFIFLAIPNHLLLHFKTKTRYKQVIFHDNGGEKISKKNLSLGESNSGLARDRRVYWPLYEGRFVENCSNK